MLRRPERKPEWLRVRLPAGDRAAEVRRRMRSGRLHTVCEEAQCPNQGECWGHGTATFLILGDVCTRRCGFCAIGKGRPGPVDLEEPRHLAETVAALGLRFTVITSVDRDDLPDGGAFQFVACIQAIRQHCPGVGVEVLVPDFKGDHAAIEKVVAARPEVLAHNVETVPRLYRRVRPGSRYQRSLDVLRHARAVDPGLRTKSNLMLGLGERREEILEVLRDLREVGCESLTIGQYLAPSRSHLPVMEYVHPDTFAEYGRLARGLGFLSVASGPLVRSSYMAEQQLAGGPVGIALS